MRAQEFFAENLVYDGSNFNPTRQDYIDASKRLINPRMWEALFAEKTVAMICITDESFIGKELRYVAVLSEYKRRGIAKNLIKRVFGDVPELDYLVVTPEIGNKEGIQFYKKIGGIEIPMEGEEYRRFVLCREDFSCFAARTRNLS